MSHSVFIGVKMRQVLGIKRTVFLSVTVKILGDFYYK